MKKNYSSTLLVVTIIFISLYLYAHNQNTNNGQIINDGYGRCSSLVGEGGFADCAYSTAKNVEDRQNLESVFMVLAIVSGIGFFISYSKH